MRLDAERLRAQWLGRYSGEQDECDNFQNCYLCGSARLIEEVWAPGGKITFSI